MTGKRIRKCNRRFQKKKRVASVMCEENHGPIWLVKTQTGPVDLDNGRTYEVRIFRTEGKGKCMRGDDLVNGTQNLATPVLEKKGKACYWEKGKTEKRTAREAGTCKGGEV